MKSNNMIVGMSLLCLALAVLASTLVWSDIAFPVKVGMYALGFSMCVLAGALIGGRKEAHR